MTKLGALKTNLSSPAEYREAMRGEGDPGDHTCIVWQNAHITLYSSVLSSLWHLGSLPSRRFTALAGNDNLHMGSIVP